jgi:hypothetical protein
MQKQTYENEKKKITSDLACVLNDPSVVIVSDWLKVRGTLRNWTRLWAILKPGLLLLYRGPNSTVRDQFDSTWTRSSFLPLLLFLWPSRMLFGSVLLYSPPVKVSEIIHIDIGYYYRIVHFNSYGTSFETIRVLFQNLASIRQINLDIKGNNIRCSTFQFYSIIVRN